MTDPIDEYRARLRVAMDRMAELRAALTAERRARSEPIAVIGIGGRFPPDTGDPDVFFDRQLAGQDATREPDPRRHGAHLRRGGWLDDVRGFDAAFFGISPREAAAIDPQQRLLLESTWEALERAGQAPASLAGRRVGCFVGLTAADYLHLALALDPADLDIYALTGNGHCFAAGRLAYSLGLDGPCMTVDTACSSSLVALHLAVRSLRAGESALAIAAGVHLVLAPTSSVLLAGSGALAPDGRCKTFDAAADGFTRGEGCGVLVLKRLADARRDGDPVLALVRGSATNQDGRSAGFTAPNALAQVAVIRQALADADLAPADIGVLETHGTGTALGDPIELQALSEVFGGPRPAPLILGALKSHVGHLEAAAGIAGVIKAILCLRRGAVPPNLHFKSLNPHAAIAGADLLFPTAATTWPKGQVPRRAGVSSFGMSGSNAHVILEEAPEPDAPPLPPPPPYLLTLSARTPAALAELARTTAAALDPTPATTSTHDLSDRNLAALDSRPTSDRDLPALDPTDRDLAALDSHPASDRDLTDRPADARLADFAYTAIVGRQALPHRLALVTGAASDAARVLRDFAAGDVSGELAHGLAAGAPRPVFVFSGQGSAWPGMGVELRDEPAARAVLDALEPEIQQHGGFSLRAALAAPDARLADTSVAQPAIFAVSLAVAAVLRSWGIEPAAVLGHSVGEISAAHLAGILGLADAARLVCVRGRVMQRAAGRGGMVTAELDPDAARSLIAPYGDHLAVAAINAPRSVVLAGDLDALESVLATLGSREIRARRVRVDFAFHSPQMTALQPALRAELGPLQPARATLRMVSTVTGDPVDGPELGPEHWAQGLRRPVLMARAVARTLAAGHRFFLEIGPHPVLLADLRACVADVADCTVTPTLWRDRPARPALLRTLAALFVAGHPLDPKALFPAGGRIAPLPTYPWQRRDHWLAQPRRTAPDDLSQETPDLSRATAASNLSRETPSSNLSRETPASSLSRETPASNLSRETASDLSRATASDLSRATASSDLSRETPGLSRATLSDPAPPLLAAARRAAPEARRALLARVVRAEVGAVLGLTDADPIAAHQGLFDIGLDSMTAVELRARLERRLGVPLAPTLVFDHPTLAALAAHLAGDLTTRAEPHAARTDDPIAIVGAACRLPGGADDPARYWRLLQTAADATRDVPPDRWDAAAFYDPDPDAPGKTYARRSGFLAPDTDVGGFDAPFFKISPLEARGLDPQQRLLLELAWEALEDGGQSPDALVGSRTGVYVGIATADYAQIATQVALADLDPYVGTGNAPNTAAGRISHFLGLRGPAIALDTACSSSLVAAHLACHSLRRGETDLALVGGVNLMLAPIIPVMYARMRALAPDSRCKAFDAAADGMVRGEGGVILLLKRLSDARRDGDRVLALIRGSAINHDGRSAGLTVPSGAAQREVLRAALADAGAAPTDITFIETHGTGTALGDPIEANALLAELGPSRPPERPLHLGAVKASIGHLEAAAGVAGLLKAALALQHGQIPPQRNFERLNPAIVPGPVPLVVPTTLTPWPPGPRLAGVSSFGMSGTNAHIILAPPPGDPDPAPPNLSPAIDPGPSHLSPGTFSSPAPPNLSPAIDPGPSHLSPGTFSSPAPSDLSPGTFSAPAPSDLSRGTSSAPAPSDIFEGTAPRGRILPLSARGPAALRALAERYRERLADPACVIDPLCAAAARRRAHLEHRLALVGETREDLLAALDAHLRDEIHPGWAATRSPGEHHRLAFVFAGHSGHWVGMGRELYASEPVFAAAMRTCDRALAPHRDGSLLADLFAADAATRWSAAEVLQPLVLAVQIALAELWSSWGVTPQAVVGHSMGEIAAACVAGALDVADAMKICTQRSRLVERLRGRGAMASVAVPVAQIEAHLAPFAGRISVAAANSPLLTVLSGDPDALRELGEGLARDNIFVRPMRDASGAGHSPQLDPHLPELAAALADLRPRATAVPFYSTVTAGELPGESLGAAYWPRNLREPVQFARALEALGAAGFDAFLEVSPHPTLLGAIEQTLRPRGGALTRVGSLKSHAPERPALLATLARLYADGHEIDWSGLAPRSPWTPLPAYPWQRRRHWLDVPTYRGAGAHAAPAGAHPLLPRPIRVARRREHLWDFTLPPPRRDDAIRVQSIAVTPTSRLLELALAAARHLSPETALADLTLGPTLAHDGPLDLQIIVADPEAAPATVELLAAPPGAPWQTLARARLASPVPSSSASVPSDSPSVPSDIPAALADLQARCPAPLADLRERLLARGLELPPALWLELWTGPTHELLARVRHRGAPGTACPPAALECGLQLLTALAHDPADRPVPGELFTVRALDRLELHAPAAEVGWVHVALRGPVGPSFGGTGDIHLHAPDGRPVAALRGVHVAPPDRGLARLALFKNLDRWLYDLRWEPAPAVDARREPPGSWLLLADDGGLADRLARHLADRGERPLLVRRPAGRGPADLSALLHDARARGPLRAVLHLRGLDPPPAATLPESVTEEGAALLALAQALAAAGLPARLVVLTRGAQPVTPGPLAVAAGPLWGLARTIGLEQPDVRVKLIDLPPTQDLSREPADLSQKPAPPNLSREPADLSREPADLSQKPAPPNLSREPADLSRAPADLSQKPADLSQKPALANLSREPADLSREPAFDEIAAIVAELDDVGAEDLIGLRGGVRHVARLVRATLPTIAPLPLAARPDATYLITGGLGGVGLQVARWLVDRGARHLLLVGRTGLPATPGEPGGLAWQRHEALNHLRAAGAEVRVVAADVADLAAMRSVLADIAHLKKYPLRGVFHVAGNSAPELLARTAPAVLRDLYRPKVGGGWVLHTLTKDLALDHFVGFSSAAATWGAALLGPYAAANSFLDVLAHHRRALGLPGLAVAWGGWSGGGMASAEVQRYAADMGLDMAPAAQFLEALDLFLQAGTVHATIGPIRWRMFKAVLEVRGPRPLLQQIEDEQAGPAGAGPAALKISAAPLAARRDLLLAHVHAAAATVLGFDDPQALDPDQGFFQLGMDSVMSVRLRGDLEVSLGAALPPTLAFEHPTVRALTDWLARELFGLTPPITDPPPRELQPDDTAAALDAMSEDQLAALLAAELGDP